MSWIRCYCIGGRSLFPSRDCDLPNTVQGNLFTLESTTYEIMIGGKPYDGMEDDEIQLLYTEKVFPVL